MTDEHHPDPATANAPRDPRHDPALPAPPPLDDETDEALRCRATPPDQEPNRWLRDGPDAPDAADIDDPATQL